MKNVTTFILLASVIIGAASCSSVNSKTKPQPKPVDMGRYASIMHELSQLYDNDTIVFLIDGEKRWVIDCVFVSNYVLTRENTVPVYDTDQYIVIMAKMVGPLAKFRTKLKK